MRQNGQSGKTDKTDTRDSQNGKMGTFKQWKYKIKAKLINHTVVRQNKTDKADKQNGKMRTLKQWKYRTKANIIKVKHTVFIPKYVGVGCMVKFLRCTLSVLSVSVFGF